MPHDGHDHETEQAHWYHRSKKPPVLLTSLAIIALTLWIGAMARNAWRQYKFIGVPVERNTITVSGEGKIVAVPDVAGIDLGTSTARPTVAAAQQENSRVMNALIAGIKKLGVDAKDIQTIAYQIYPQYEYPNGQAVLRGYVVTESVHVKARELDKVSDIVGLAGSLGANQVGGISFSVDDPEGIKEQAREKALEQAKAKAKALSKIAGVTLRRVVSFEENTSSPPGPFPYYAKADSSGSAASPTIEAGSSEIVVNVNVTYEIE